jgi:hypothetical protein
MPGRYFVYVIELDAAVTRRRRFRGANPRMKAGLEPLYVGSSVQPPDLRFDQHKEGYRGNRFVREFGLRLRPDLFEQYNPIPSRGDALEIEEYLAERLRAKGHGVWQH